MTIVEKWRAYKGWTLDELGKRMGLSESTIGSHCTVQKNLQRKTLEKFARAFDVTPDEFLAGPQCQPEKESPLPTETTPFLSLDELQNKIITLVMDVSDLPGGYERLLTCKYWLEKFRDNHLKSGDLSTV